MSILCREWKTEDVCCEISTDSWEQSDLYRCDSCKRVICEDCKDGNADPDCPNEICVECVEAGK